jgi:phosphoribosylglycinamide formyltransferase-1
MNNTREARRKRIAVFASGFGSNLQAIIDYSGKNDINGDIVMVLTNNPDAYAIKRARDAGIEQVIIPFEKSVPRSLFDSRIMCAMQDREIDLVCLAGYMLLLSPDFIEKYRGRIINVHPSLLPSFKGIHGISDAFDYGVKITGVTIHFVENELDTGPIILQEAVEVKEDEDAEQLEKKIHEAEHRLYPLAVKYFCMDRLKIIGRKVFIKERD